MRSMPKMKLSCYDRLDRVQSLMKTRHENDVTNRISLVFVETKIELSGLISQGGVCDENQKDNDLTDHAGVFNVKTDIKLS